MKPAKFCISMISYGKEFHRPVTYSIMLTHFNVPITIMLKKKRFASLLPSALLHAFTSVSGVGSLGPTGNFRIYTKAQNQEVLPSDCRAVSCQQWCQWWLMGLEGTEWASGQHLRCKHSQDHGKSSHTNLITNTLSYWTRTRQLLVSAAHEMVQQLGPCHAASTQAHLSVSSRDC